MRTQLIKSAVLIPVFILLFFSSYLAGPKYSPPPAAEGGYPIMPDAPIRNIIFFIGDGMGISQISAGRICTVGPDGRLNIEKMPVTGLLCNHSLDDLITDSAAGATALATGFKTNNGMIAMLPDNTRAKTILQAARDKGLSTGLVATSSITHATPACFASHVSSRGSQEEIARQLIEEEVSVLLGGGKNYFIPQSDPKSKRSDDIDLISRAREKGYEFVETREDLLKSQKNRLLGLFRPGALKNEPEEPSLAELTAKAIQLLNRNPKGFFLMVEGSQIDWGSHDNDLEYMLREMRSFDEAVKVGLDFALQDKYTLVVVTADHETGGLAIVGGKPDGSDFQAGWVSKHHTGQPVPVFAFGPHSLLFTGIKDNTAVPQIFARLLGIEDFPQKMPGR